MRQPFFLTLMAVLAPHLALAQVSVNPAALQQLAGITAPAAPPIEPVAAPLPPPVHHKATHPPAPPHATARPPAPVPATARVLAPAPAPKPAPVTPPPAATAPAAPPAAVSFSFAPGSAVLPATAAAALKPFCAAPGRVAINARAPADPNDPSAAMRLSLARAMAVQAALTGCGVAPQNILPRALGDVPGQDENQITVGSANR